MLACLPVVFSAAAAAAAAVVAAGAGETWRGLAGQVRKACGDYLTQ